LVRIGSEAEGGLDERREDVEAHPHHEQVRDARVEGLLRTLHLGLGALCLNALAHLRRRLVGRLVAVCCLVAVSYASVAGSPSLGSGA